MPDTSTFGSQTLLGPAWVSMDEDELSAAAASFEALAAHLRGVVMPQLQGQMMVLSGDWGGSGSNAAMGEASAIINGHEMNAAQASSIANKLRRMEASVAKVKALLNATAQRTQEQCESIMAGPGFGPEKIAAVQSQVAMGLAQNMSEVTAGTTELGDGLGVPTSGVPGMAAASNPQEAMQMVSQLTSKVGQVPQQLGKMAGGGGGPMQQLMQPLQQLTSMFGKGGKGGGPSSSLFSNHPAAGGTGARSGAGMARGGMPGGGGGSAARTPLMANLVGHSTSAAATASAAAGAAAGGRVGGGSAPVSSGGAGGGTGGMMGGRGSSGGSRTAMAVPAPLDHELTDDEVDDEW